MKLLKLTVLSFFLALTASGLSQAQEVFLLGAASEFCGDVNQFSSLYRINPATAEAEFIGETGFDGLTALEILPDGRLVGSANDDDEEDIAVLIDINPFTGQGSLIGEIGNDGSGSMTCGRAPGMTLDPNTNMLYATARRCDEDIDTAFQSINTSTGQGTVIGPTGFDFGGHGLARRDDGTLFSYNATTLITINPDTGQGTEVGGVLRRGTIGALDFHPVTGELYGIFKSRSESTLIIVDTETGDFTELGALPDCADGLVFGQIQPRPIPTLSQWGLIAMAGVLGIIGLLAIRRRQSVA